jgi:hypothetical protein
MDKRILDLFLCNNNIQVVLKFYQSSRNLRDYIDNNISMLSLYPVNDSYKSLFEYLYKYQLDLISKLSPFSGLIYAIKSQNNNLLIYALDHHFQKINPHKPITKRIYNRLHDLVAAMYIMKDQLFNASKFEKTLNNYFNYYWTSKQQIITCRNKPYEEDFSYWCKKILSDVLLVSPPIQTDMADWEKIFSYANTSETEIVQNIITEDRISYISDNYTNDELDILKENDFVMLNARINRLQYTMSDDESYSETINLMEIEAKKWWKLDQRILIPYPYFKPLNNIEIKFTTYIDLFEI